MRNNLLKPTVAAVMLFSLVFGAPGVMAQGTSSGSGSAAAGTALAVPAGYTVIPPDDSDRSDDQILQLNNLTIQNISGSVPGTIYASHDIGGTCREYLDTNTATSKIYPCPLAPTVLYQISVKSDTILLLKNRARASIGDFAVGDHINVFGFLDPGTSAIEALIVRDLDKPVLGSRYVQLNNLTVVSAPDSSVAPATFQAARKGIEPCLAFPSESSARGMPAPCPLGVEISASASAAGTATGALAELPANANAELYRPFQQYYSVHVSSLTRILDVSRRTIGLGSIQEGDRVNIYGRYNPSNRTIEALIVRDLSVPRTTGAAQIQILSPNGGEEWVIGQSQHISWSMQNIPSNAYLHLSLINGPTPVNVRSISPIGKTTSIAFTPSENGCYSDYCYTFEPGRYQISAVVYDRTPCLGLCPADDASYQAKVIARDVSNGYVNISEGSSLRILSPNGGEALQRGSTVSIRWSPDSDVSNAADIFIQSEFQCNGGPGVACPAVMPNEYTVARGVGQPASDGTMTYRWTVPNTIEKVLLGDGRYRIEVCYAGSSTCDWSDNSFNVISAYPATQ